MQSVPMVCSFEALETLHNHHMKGNNTFFKQAMNELLTG
jgi:hypothetical protein